MIFQQISLLTSKRRESIEKSLETNPLCSYYRNSVINYKSILSTPLLSFLFPLNDRRPSIPPSKRLGNDSSRKHPPGYPFHHTDKLSTTSPTMGETMQQPVYRLACWLRITKAGGGPPIIVPHLCDSTRNPLCASVQRHGGGATGAEKWAGTGSIQLSVMHCENDVAMNDLREVERRVSADRFVKSMGSRIFFKLPRVLSSSKCLESSRREIWSAFRLLLESFVR